MHKSTWQKLDSETVYDNPWYKVRRDKVLRPDGKEGAYNVVEMSRPSVFVVALNAADELLLVHMFRYTTQHEGWEVPAGGVEAGETLEAAARRELKEETGCAAGSLEHVGSFDSMNSITNSLSHVFIASQLTQTAHNQQAEEGIIKQKYFSKQAVIQKIQSNELMDGQSIVAFMKYVAHSTQS